MSVFVFFASACLTASEILIFLEIEMSFFSFRVSFCFGTFSDFSDQPDWYSSDREFCQFLWFLLRSMPFCTWQKTALRVTSLCACCMNILRSSVSDVHSFFAVFG